MKSYFFRIISVVFTFWVSVAQGQLLSKKSEALYPKEHIEKSNFYNFLWGEHYRELYALEILAPDFLDKNPRDLIPVTENYPYFQYFSEFEKLYEREKFEGTYSDRFIADAYTLIHPMAFVLTDGLARNIGLNPENIVFFYNNEKLHKAVNPDNDLLTTDEVLFGLEEGFQYKIDEKLFVRSRLLDMIVGNSLCINDSYLWKIKNESVYYPYRVDRGFSFLKKDGLFYEILLQSLGIKNVQNYYKQKLSSKKINSHNYTVDLVLSSKIKEQVWLEEAGVVKEIFTEDVLQGVFASFPENFQNSKVHNELKQALIHRISNIEILAKEYFEILQEIAIIKGSAQDDVFEISQSQSTTIITVKDREGNVILKNEYLIDRTKEIWLYGLGGIDSFVVQEFDKNDIIIRIINNDHYNEYILNKAPDNIKLYATTESVVTSDEIGSATLFKTDNFNVLDYSQDRPKNHTFVFQPGILLDTDLALRLGGKFTYTRYAFKKQPFSSRHELSWNHYYSALYSGIFPTWNQKRMYTADLWITSSNHFQNFFGFGNESENYESSFGREYNRVMLQRLGLDLGVAFDLLPTQKVKIKLGLERFHIVDGQKFHRDDIFQEGELTDKTNLFLNIKANYQLSSSSIKENDRFDYLFIPEVGLMLNFRDMNRNVPYLSGELSLKYNPDVNQKYTIATVLSAKALLNETFEFYQAATMGGEAGLRGYRNERFSGQQYFVHSTDFRIDIGKLTNRVVPLSFEPFLGFDYGRVWYLSENSKKWHTSLGGGFSFKVINKFNTNISYFTSSERPRITLSLGYFF